jgi:hypothetical protein
VLLIRLPAVGRYFPSLDRFSFHIRVHPLIHDLPLFLLQDWVQRSNPPNVMGQGAYGNAMGVHSMGYGMRPQSYGGMGGMDAPQNLMPWAAASQSFSPLHLPDPILPPHASLSERRDYLLGASLPPHRFVEDINFMVPLIPPSAMSFNERLRHNLDLENRFCPPQQSKVGNTTLKAESGG